MKLFRALFILNAIFILMFSLTGCGLIGSLINAPENITISDGQLPIWLTLAHRAEATALQDTEFDTAPAFTQPSISQTILTQPDQQAEEQISDSSIQRWQQPGTMEYIAKQQLDQLAFTYKSLYTQIADFKGEENDLKALKEDLLERYKTISEIAGSIGLNLDREYGIKPPPAEAKETTTDSTWFQSWDQSPSGFSE